MPVAQATTTTTQQAEGIAGCWMGAAEAARQAAEAAAPALRDKLGTLIQREAELAEAAATGDPGVFAPAFDRFLKAMEPVMDSVALKRPLDAARSELAQCRGDDEGAGDLVDPCWKQVASGYEAAMTAAEAAILRGGAPVTFAVEEMIKAGEDRNVEGFGKAVRDLSAGVETLQRLAAGYASELGDAERLSEDCRG
jgi:hypothetical protein